MDDLTFSEDLNNANEEETFSESSNIGQSSKNNVSIEEIRKNPIYNFIKKFMPSGILEKNVERLLENEASFNEKVDQVFEKIQSKMKQEAEEHLGEEETYSEGEELNKKAYVGFLSKMLSKIPVYGHYWVRVEALKRFLKDSSANFYFKSLSFCFTCIYN